MFGKIGSSVIGKMNDATTRFSVKHREKVLYAAGAALFASGLESVAHAQTYDVQVLDQVCKILVMSQGTFGALIMSVAGLVAVIGAATGAYRSAMNAIAVGAGAWLIRPVIMLFFGDIDCNSLNYNFPTIGG
ncbi:MAG: hypothetical protein IT290_06800 [Deltaproteobacteria bacterium]|nr:hypothetical protein [Deltaproteobacteria bacterium]